MSLKIPIPSTILKTRHMARGERQLVVHFMSDCGRKKRQQPKSVYESNTRSVLCHRQSWTLLVKTEINLNSLKCVFWPNDKVLKCFKASSILFKHHIECPSLKQYLFFKSALRSFELVCQLFKRTLRAFQSSAT